MIQQYENPVENTTEELIRQGDALFGWGIALIVIGLIFIILLIIFTEFKRKERESVKFSIIIMVIAGFCLGFGIEFLLQFYGLW